MPAVVDRDARRLRVAEIAYDLVAERGLDALTIRAVASAAGDSTAVVSHYFADKRELLLFVYEMAAGRAAAHWADILARGGDLRECLESLLPVDMERQRYWRVWFCFWSAAFTDADLAAAQRLQVSEARERVVTGLRRETELAAASVKRLAPRLLSTVIGIAIQAAFDAESWPPAQQRLILADELAGILPSQAAPRRRSGH